MQGAGLVSNLPVELLAEIFSFLRAQELGLIAALVCKTWWKVICRSSDDGSYGVSPWRSLLIRDYGVPASYEKSEDSWLECYQIFARWSWDSATCPKSVVLSEANCRATLKETGLYHAVTTAKPLYPGTHLFEITMLKMENALTTEHGIGVGNLSVHQINGWHDTNDGVGWYSKGSFYNRGSGQSSGHVSTYDEGDTVGLYINLSAESGKSYVRWFKNRMEVNGMTSLKYAEGSPSIYPTVLLANMQEVKIKYRGRTIPSDYLTSGNVWG